jgi:DNA-binding transcriptional LysR family regulator
MLDERERRQRIEAEYNQLLQHLQQQQKPQGPETIFDAPDEYLNQRVIAPLRQEMQMEMMKRTDMQSREFANVQFGQQAVDAALAEISRIRQTPQGDFIFRQIMQSGHPYGELVKWHNQARAQQAIGNDPQAWLRQQQQAWFNDPKVQEAMAQHLRQKYAQQQQQNGSGNPPNVSLPPSLSSVPSSSGRGVELGDLSSESLFQHAIK